MGENVTTKTVWGGLHPFGGAPAVTGAAYWHGWDGQALIEYALIVTLVVVVVLIVLIAMGNQLHNVYCNISGSLPG